jgi:hypothetical protein
MAKAIFSKDFNFSSRKTPVGWAVKAKKTPQSFPEELIAAACDRGAAERVAPKRAPLATEISTDD